MLASAARDADVALCLECARENGDLVAARKGVIDLELEIEDCPPMEQTSASELIGAAAAEIAESLGFSIRLATTGGVSDANRVSALGVPTLDGLGPIGGGGHTPGEWLQLHTVPQRVAFLATLIDTLGAASPVEADSLEALRTAASA